MSNAHWLALTTISGIGGVTARKLIDRFGDVESIFAASVEELIEIPRVTTLMAPQLLAAPIHQLDSEMLSLSDEGIDLLTWDDDRFPTRLRPLSDAPMVLFMRGAVKRTDENAVAIVGTREPSPAAVETATRLGRELAERGLTIISGLALGIDTAGHRGAIETGRTIAVLGSGIRFIHPKENIELAEDIIGCGAVLSELHPNTPPRGQNLMARDRIISGLSRAVIVIEAGEKSGSLDTASKAIKQGRFVYAVPGSAGTDQLIAGGARVINPASLDFDALAAEVSQSATRAEPPAPHQASLWQVAPMVTTELHTRSKCAPPAGLDRLKSGVNSRTMTVGRAPFRRRQAAHPRPSGRGTWTSSSEEYSAGSNRQNHSSMQMICTKKIDAYT